MSIKQSGFLLVLAVLAGCSGASSPPKNAYRPPETPAAPAAHKGEWSKEDKIAAVENSGMPAEQKKSTIEQIKAGKL